MLKAGINAQLDPRGKGPVNTIGAFGGKRHGYYVGSDIVKSMRDSEGYSSSMQLKFAFFPLAFFSLLYICFFADMWSIAPLLLKTCSKNALQQRHLPLRVSPIRTQNSILPAALIRLAHPWCTNGIATLVTWAVLLNRKYLAAKAACSHKTNAVLAHPSKQ